MRVVAVLVLAASIIGAGLVTQASAGEKVTICHATASTTNPYVEVTVSLKAWESGHSPHSIHVEDYIGECIATATATATPTSDATSATMPTATATTPLPTPTATSESTNTQTSSTSISATPTPEVPIQLPNSGGAPPEGR